MTVNPRNPILYGCFFEVLLEDSIGNLLFSSHKIIDHRTQERKEEDYKDPEDLVHSGKFAGENINKRYYRDENDKNYEKDYE